jgi:hypothetical protein
MQRTDIPEELRRRMVDDNGRAAFDIPKDFRPTDALTLEQRTQVDLGVI